MAHHVLLIVFVTSLLGGAAAAGDDGDADASRFWPQWRGPLGTGVAPHADPPVRWSETENVRWKLSLPGSGHSTPIVWGDRVFLTTAIPHGDPVDPVPETAPGAHDNVASTLRYEFVAMAVGRQDGRMLWARTLTRQLPHEGGHYTASPVSNSPVTDGRRLYAYLGSRGLYCLDLDGAPLWHVDLGRMQTKHGHGEGSSPAVHGETVVVTWDHEGPSFLVALDARTGAQRWRVPRDEPTSWSTPIIVEHRGTVQVVVSGTKRLRGYDLASGEVIWECGGLSNNVVASPVAGNGMVFAGSSYESKAMLAIRLDDAHGDLTTSDHLIWMRRRRTPYVPSPLLYGESLYFLHHYQGTLSRVVARTGEEPHGPHRLAGIRNVYASPVAASGRVYITDLDGTTVVLSDEDQPQVLARNSLDDRFSASAAIVDGELYLRGEERLYCIARDEARPPEPQPPSP